MFCARCGKQIEDDSTFCPFCGQQADAPVVSKKPTIGMRTTNPIKERISAQTKKWLIGAVAGLVTITGVTIGTVKLIGDSRSDKEAIAISEVDESSSNDIVPENSEAVYYITEEELVSRLYSFVDFCTSKVTDVPKGESTWDGSLEDLLRLSANEVVKTTQVAIYDYDSRLIITQSFSERLERSDSNNHPLIDFLKDVHGGGINWADCFGSNIHETYHYYEGSDAKVYVGYSLGKKDHSYIIEMVLSTDDPHTWLINDIYYDKKEHGRLKDKLKNEDGVAWETEPKPSYSDIFSEYISLNMKGDRIAFNIVDLNSDEVPECVCTSKDTNDYFVLLTDGTSVYKHDLNLEVDFVTGERASIDVGLESDLGCLRVEEQVQGKCHVRSEVSEEYDDSVDYMDSFLFSYSDDYDVAVEYRRTWYRDYAVSADGKSLEITDLHSVEREIYELKHAGKTYKGSLIAYDGLIGNTYEYEIADSYPFWWDSLYNKAHIVSMSSIEVNYYGEVVNNGYTGSYEEYRSEHVKSEEQLSDEWQKEYSKSAVNGDYGWVKLNPHDKWVASKMSQQDWIDWITLPADGTSYFDFLTLGKFVDGLTRGSEIEFIDSWGDVDSKWR